MSWRCICSAHIGLPSFVAAVGWSWVSGVIWPQSSPIATASTACWAPPCVGFCGPRNRHGAGLDPKRPPPALPPSRRTSLGLGWPGTPFEWRFHGFEMPLEFRGLFPEQPAAHLQTAAFCFLVSLPLWRLLLLNYYTPHASEQPNL